MIKQFGDFATTQAVSEGAALPKDGYVCKILNAQVKDGTKGQYLQIAYDIAEGQYKDYFKGLYDAKKDENKKWSTYFFVNLPKDDGSEKDGWTKRLFKTFTNALEDSNEGYHFDWDETKFKDKLIGGLFHYEEYQRNDGKVGRATKMRNACSVEKIRSGNFNLPEDKLLATPAANTSSDFMSIPDGIDGEIPFK